MGLLTIKKNFNKNFSCKKFEDSIEAAKINLQFQRPPIEKMDANVSTFS